MSNDANRHICGDQTALMNWYQRLEYIRSKLDLSYRELGDLTGTSPTQVGRWMDGEAHPTGPQKAIIQGLHEWSSSERSFEGGKGHLLHTARQFGHYDFLKLLFCRNGGN